MKYRKLPIVVEALQWDGSKESLKAICKWANQHPFDDPNVDYVTSETNGIHDVLCHTLEGTLNVSADDWIIKGIHGEFYPCKPDVFEATYEAVAEGLCEKEPKP